MIEIEGEQGSEQWIKARLGVPSASMFESILTGTGKVSTKRKGYLVQLLAEKLTQEQTYFRGTYWTDRGTELEPEAANLYEFMTGETCIEKGFLLDDSSLWGCSPDRLIEGKEKGLEIKCPSPQKHVEYLLSGKIPTQYMPQVQGCMLVTGFESWDFMSYCPSMKPLIVRVERDEEYITKLREELIKFSTELTEKFELLKA